MAAIKAVSLEPQVPETWSGQVPEPLAEITTPELDSAEVPAPEYTATEPARESQGQVSKFILLALAGAQAHTTVPARELCTSVWFTLARAWVEAQDCPWMLLSARYGLVYPHQVLAPYQLDVTRMGLRQRAAWARGVARQARCSVPCSQQLVLVAGNKYCDCLLPHLSPFSDEVQLPLKGLSVGFQCGWLRSHTPVAASPIRHGEARTGQIRASVQGNSE